MRTDLETKDRYNCPISLEPIRHPVVASDGKTYELEQLAQWLQNNETSPLTKEKITRITYDHSLKKELDILNLSGRYRDYWPQWHLMKLTWQINQTIQPWQLAAYKSAFTVSSALLCFLTAPLFFNVLLSTDTKEQNDLDPLELLLFFALAGLLDFGTRLASHDRYSFFKIISSNRTQQTQNEPCYNAALPPI